MIPSEFNEEQIKELLATRKFDPNRLHNFVKESLSLSKAHIDLMESTMPLKERLEARIDHCHIEIFLSSLRRLQGF